MTERGLLSLIFVPLLIVVPLVTLTTDPFGGTKHVTISNSALTVIVMIRTGNKQEEQGEKREDKTRMDHCYDDATITIHTHKCMLWQMLGKGIRRGVRVWRTWNGSDDDDSCV